MPIKTYISLICLLVAAASCRKAECPACGPDVANDVSIIKTVTLQDQANDIIVGGSKDMQLFFAFGLDVDGRLPRLTLVEHLLPILFRDELGNSYDLFGRITRGPDKGKSLKPVQHTKAYWYAWSAIYPTLLYKGIPGSGTIHPPNSVEWAISTDFVNRGAVQDAIPALDYPDFDPYDKKNALNEGYLFPDDEVIAVQVGNRIKVYPIKILNFHEIVNDSLGGIEYVLAYHPYTKSTSVWVNPKDNPPLNFGVSGLIYNNNMLLFDRRSGSLWSQMLGKGVNGLYKNKETEPLSYIQTTWQTWQELYSDFQIMDVHLGFGFDYDINPLQELDDDPTRLPFPISNYDDRLPLKEEVLGVVLSDKTIVFEWSDF